MASPSTSAADAAGEGIADDVVRHLGPQADGGQADLGGSPLDGALHAGGHVDGGAHRAEPGELLGRTPPRPAGWAGCAAPARGRRRGPRPCERRSPSPGRLTAPQNARHRWSGSAPTSSRRSLPSTSVPARSSMLGQVEPGEHAVDEVHRRAAGPVVEQLVGVEGGDRHGVERVEERGAGVLGAEPGVDPAVEARATRPATRGRAPRATRRAPAISSSAAVGRLARRGGATCGFERLEAGGVAHRPSGVAAVDALDDAGQLPVPEGDVEVELGQVAVGRGGVAVDELGPGGEPGGQRRRDAEEGGLGVGRGRSSTPAAGRRRRADRRACRSPSRGRRRRCRRRRPCSCRGGSRRGRWPRPAARGCGRRGGRAPRGRGAPGGSVSSLDAWNCAYHRLSWRSM